jgi:hypothetical protein
MCADFETGGARRALVTLGAHLGRRRPSRKSRSIQENEALMASYGQQDDDLGHRAGRE